LAWLLALHLGWQQTGVFWAVFVSETSVGLFTLWLFSAVAGRPRRCDSRSRTIHAVCLHSTPFAARTGERRRGKKRPH
jgi:hypothetical protein